MIGTYDLVTTGLSVILSLGAVAVCLFQRVFLRYLLPNLYLLSIAAFTLAGLYFIRTGSINSSAYFHFYNTGSAIIGVMSYLLIASFFKRLFRYSRFRRYVQATLLFYFMLVFGISGLFAYHNFRHVRTSMFLVELDQNMSFVCVLLIFLLWLSMNHLREENRRFMLMVSSLGMYFSTLAASFALQQLVPDWRDALGKLPPLVYALMVLLWLYTFLRVPESVESTTQNGPHAANARMPDSGPTAIVAISRPPGIFLNRFAEFFCSPKTLEEVAIPIISDMRIEYCKALAANRNLKAVWVRLRAYWEFWKALGWHRLLKTFAEIWRIVT